MASMPSEFSRSGDRTGIRKVCGGLLKETRSCDLARFASALTLAGVANPLASIARSVDGKTPELSRGGTEGRKWEGFSSDGIGKFLISAILLGVRVNDSGGRFDALLASAMPKPV
jgi:hypothetical protein